MTDCNPDWKNADFSLYRYEPQAAPAYIFVVLFGLTTILHGFQMIKTRTWYLGALFAGGICEVIGYIGRIMGANEDPGCWSLGAYIIQSIFILIAPACMAASIYMILGRIILLTDGEDHAIIKSRWLTKIFVTADVFSLLMQSSGGGMMGAADATNNFMNIGEYVIIGGLFVQIIAFGFFIVTAGLFHLRLSRNPTRASMDPKVRWQWYLMTLYVTSVLIWIRSLFRAIEYIQGNDGYLMKTEVFLYVLDATLIFIAMIWMNWFHPSEIKMLLRGEQPIQNGFELVKSKRKFGKLHSAHGSVDSATAMA